LAEQSGPQVGGRRFYRLPVSVDSSGAREDLMKKLVAATLFSALFSVSAMAGEATVLTSKAMDEVTAGFRVNYNNTSQTAVALAYGGCNYAFCGKKSGNAVAIAANINVTSQEND
jgi:hypothetical protein